MLARGVVGAYAAVGGLVDDGLTAAEVEFVDVVMGGVVGLVLVAVVVVAVVVVGTEVVVEVGGAVVVEVVEVVAVVVGPGPGPIGGW